MSSFNIAAFVDWWTRGLLGCLPAFLRALLRRQRPRIVYSPEAERFRVHKESAAGVEELGELGAEGASAMPPREREVAVLRVPGGLALVKELRLPQAAAENLRDVVGFELDRHTPFQAADTYFDYRVVGRDRLAQQLRLQLVTVPRRLVDEWVERLHALGVAPAIVDVVGLPTAVNLLPVDRRPRPRRTLQRLNGLLLLLGALLLASAAFIPLWKERVVVVSLLPQVAVAEKRAEAVAVLRRGVERALRTSEFLQRRRIERPFVTDVVLELTRILPDGTWLSQLSLNGNEVDLRGESTEASGLIALLQASELFDDAEFRSPITTNTASGRDRFYIQARLAAAAGLQ